MPENWSFGQFFETSIGSGSGYLEIDKNDYSGRDSGTTSFNPVLKDRDENEQALFEYWKSFVSKVPLLNDDLSLISAGFDFGESITLIDTTVYRIELETEVSYTTPTQGSNVRVNVINGQIQGNLETIFGNELEVVSSIDVEKVGNMFESVSAAIDNGFVEVEMSVVGNEVQISLTAYNEGIETPAGSTNLAVKINVAIKLDFPDYSEEELETLENVAVTGLALVGFVIIYYFTGSGFLAKDGFASGAAAAAALLAYIRDIFKSE